jgi:hypothetical protein
MEVNKPVPVTERATMLYDHLDSKAVDEDGGRFFRGSIVAAYDELGISHSHYSTVQRLLVVSGAMELIQRGARGIESVYLLHGRPDPDKLRKLSLTKPDNRATVALEQRVADIQRQIGGLDIVQALADLEKRLGELESTNGEK